MKKTAIAAVILAAWSLPAAAASYDDLNLALTYFNQGQYDNAIPLFDKAVAAGDLIPDLLRVAYLDRGVAWRAKGDPEKSLADLAAAIAAQPNDMFAYRERISTYLAANDLEKALADYEALRGLRPHDYQILMNVGMLNWQLGHIEASADAFSYFAQIDAYAWLWLQLANVRLGRPLTEHEKIAATGLWPGPLLRFFEGQFSETQVLEAAQVASNPGAICAANLYLGLWRSVHQDQAGAVPLLQAAIEKCGPGLATWRVARFERDRAAAGAPPK